MLAIGGADFSATINGEEIPPWHPVITAKNSILQFQKWKQGARCYVAVREKLEIQKWLNSYSTNLKAAIGGFDGRSLQKGDSIRFKEKNDYKTFLKDQDFVVLPWKADVGWNEIPIKRIAVIPGNEWTHLNEISKEVFLTESFIIDSLADRMGYRLKGKVIQEKNEELVSAVVSFGTIQLLPNGELTILMADHQTTGGYPRIAHIVSAHLPMVAQKQTGDKIQFRLTDLTYAEELLFKQQQHLLQLQNACKFRLEEFFNANN